MGIQYFVGECSSSKAVQYIKQKYWLVGNTYRALFRRKLVFIEAIRMYGLAHKEPTRRNMMECNCGFNVVLKQLISAHIA